MLKVRKRELKISSLIKKFVFNPETKVYDHNLRVLPFLPEEEVKPKPKLYIVK